MRVTLVDGPTALNLLRELIPLASQGGVCINVAWVRPNRLLPLLINHPKEYYIQGPDWQAALVGSSNLTAGGLGGYGQWSAKEKAIWHYRMALIDMLVCA